jgi:hypothetical protein
VAECTDILGGTGGGSWTDWRLKSGDRPRERRRPRGRAGGHEGEACARAGDAPVRGLLDRGLGQYGRYASPEPCG